MFIVILRCFYVIYVSTEHVFEMPLFVTNCKKMYKIIFSGYYMYNLQPEGALLSSRHMGNNCHLLYKLILYMANTALN